MRVGPKYESRPKTHPLFYPPLNKFKFLGIPEIGPYHFGVKKIEMLQGYVLHTAMLRTLVLLRRGHHFGVTNRNGIRGLK